MQLRSRRPHGGEPHAVRTERGGTLLSDPLGHRAPEPEHADELRLRQRVLVGPPLTLRFECLVAGPFQVNTWIVGDDSGSGCLIVDPGQASDDEELELQEAVARLGLTPAAMVNTHAHIDHVAGVHRVRAHWDVPLYLHSGERSWIAQVAQQCALFGFPTIPKPRVDGWVEDGQRLELAGLAFEVRHLPGHSPGGLALVFPGHVLTGDTLFAGSIGRTDLPGGSFEALERSIRTRLYDLPDETRVHPGHGPETTIGRERRTNPFVRG